MKAILLTRFGPPESLAVSTVPAPVCGDGMVRVRVRAVGVNFADVFGRMGLYPSIPNPPFVPGIEYSGDVVEVGKGTKGIRKGDRVVGFSRQGAYAEEVCVPSGFVAPMPRRMSYEEGAAILVTYVSAWHGMRSLAQAKEGETVLVHSAAGGVGTACIQLGRQWGCRMIGTASTDEKLELVRSMGAEASFNYVQGRFEDRVTEFTNGRGVDIVMDAVGGRIMRRSWKLMAPMGRYVLYGFAAAASSRRLNWFRLVREYLSFPIIMPPTLPSRNISLMGFNLYFVAEKTEYLRSVVRDIFALYDRGKIKPVVGNVYPLERAAEAHSFLQSRKSVGKVILTLDRGTR